MRWCLAIETRATRIVSCGKRRSASPAGSPRSASRRATGSASGHPTARSGRSCSTLLSRIGAVLVNVNPAYRPAELSYAMQHSGVRLLVSAERFKTSEYLEIIESVRAELSALERVVTIGSERAPGADDLVWADLFAAAEHVAADCLRARGHARSRRPHQHPVHQRNDR